MFAYAALSLYGGFSAARYRRPFFNLTGIPTGCWE